VVDGNLFVMGGALVQSRPLPKSEVTDKNRDIQADRLNQLRPWKELGSTDHRMMGMVDFFRFDAKTGQQLSVEPIKYPTSTYLRLVGESSILIGVNPPIWFDFNKKLVERRFSTEVKKLPYRRAKVWQYSGDTMYYVSNFRSDENSSDAIFKLKQGSSTEWVRIQEVSFPIEFHHFDAEKIVVAGPGHIGSLRTDSDSWTEMSLKEKALVPFASVSLEKAHVMLFALPVSGERGKYAATYIKILSNDLSSVYAEQLVSWIRASPKLSSQRTQNKREYGRF